MEPEKPIISDELANVLSYLDVGQSELTLPSAPAEVTVVAPAPRRLRLRRFRRWRMARQASQAKRDIDALSVPPWEKRRGWPRLETMLVSLVLLSGLTLLGTMAPWAGKERLISTLASLSERDLYYGAEETVGAEPVPPVIVPVVKRQVKPTPKPTPKPAPTPKPTPKPTHAPTPVSQPTLTLVVRGAPKPPAGELDLRVRVSRLARFVAAHPKPTDAAVSHWLRQHAWVVTGAKWGWPGGEQALVHLLAIDREVFAHWGIGSRSENRAAYALRQLRYMQAHPKVRSTAWLESYSLQR